MDTQPTAQRDALLNELEELWAQLDHYFAGLSPADWARRHGRDWHFADVPYHLAYYDQGVIVAAITRGAAVPPDELHPMRTTSELNAWNAAKFAARPADQPVARSLDSMRAARAALRALLLGLTDADLDAPVWIALPMCGWRTVRFALDSCITHTWAHLVEMRLRMHRPAGAPAPAATHRALGYHIGFMPLVLDRAQAEKTPLTIVLEFSGPGGGAWTIRVAEGRCRIAEERAPAPDLAIVQAPETFLGTMVGTQNPMRAMLTGRMKVRGMRHMSAFGKLFPPRKPDVPLPLPLEAQPAG